MTPPLAFDVLTIGHSNLPADRFLDLLKTAGVTAVADVRSVPFSRRFPWFSARALAERLQAHRIAYLAFGDALGGRPRDSALYCDGVADYDAMAATAAFRAGLDRAVDETRRHRLCLMCAEREPLESPLPAGRPRPRQARTRARPYPRRRHARAACRDRGSPALAGEKADLFRDRATPARGRLSPPRPRDRVADQTLTSA